jgi:hypothetical protein
MLPLKSRRGLVAASRCLLGANLLLPAGFFLGGIHSVAGDPGVGILLVPVGALLLLVGVFLVAQGSKCGTKAGGSRTGPSEQQRNPKTRSN